MTATETPATREERARAYLLPVLAVLISYSFILWSFLRRSGDLGWSIFVRAGDQRADASAVPDELVLRADIVGYDGQYFYRLALDPFTSEVTADGIPLDHPAYRQRRILYPLLAHWLNHLNDVSLLILLPLINVAAALVMTALVVALCRHYGRSPWWALLVALSPPIFVGVVFNLSEPLALTLAVAGVLLVVKQRYWWAGLALALAALTRETTLVIPAGIGIWAVVALLRSGGRRAAMAAAAMLIPLVALASWEVWLQQNWADTAIVTDVSRQLGIPWVAVLQGLYNPTTDVILQASDWRQWLWRVERFLLVGLFVATAFFLRSSRLPPGLKVSWVAAVLLAGAPGRGWAWDIQFVRAAAEAIVLSLAVLLATPGTRPRLVLEMMAVLSLMVIVSA